MKNPGITISPLSSGRARRVIASMGAIVLAIVLTNPGSARAEDYAKRNNEGNQLVEDGMLDRALEKYKEAEIEAPDVPEIDYNQANVFHMMGNYDSAATEYQDALATLSGPTAPAALYNLGNTLYRMQQYELAVESYKRALIEDPTDQEAKHNLELALKRLQADSSQQEPQDQDQDQEQQPDSTNQDQDQDQDQEQQQQPDSTDQQQEPQDQDSDSQPDSSETQPQPENPEDSEPGQQEPQQMPQPQGMTKEDAERLLDALKDNELEVQKKRAMKAAVPVTGKDW